MLMVSNSFINTSSTTDKSKFNPWSQTDFCWLKRLGFFLQFFQEFPQNMDSSKMEI
jgi:hypothetical protein